MNGTINETFDSIDFGNDTINGAVANNHHDNTAIVSKSKQNLSKLAITNLENLPTLQKSAMSAFLASLTQHLWSDLVRSLHNGMVDSNVNTVIIVIMARWRMMIMLLLVMVSMRLVDYFDD